MVKTLISRIVDGLFPRLCVRCGTEGADVCPACFGAALADTVGLACPICETPSRIGVRCARCSGALDGLIVSAAYANPVVGGLIRRWKFSFVRGAEKPLAEFIHRTPLADLLGGGEWTVVPVPLHRSRMHWRGFDQAAWIARMVAAEIDAPASAILERVRATPQQARRAETERSQKDLLGAFRARVPIIGRVLLCDDVYTSGATMQAAAEACRSAGASSVWGYTIARG